MKVFAKAALRGSTSLVATIVAAGIIAVPAIAQDAPAPTEEADRPLENNPDGVQTEADGRDSADGLIVVTGSRIRRPDYDSAEPTQVISSQYINERAITNVADALNEGPAIRGSVTPNGAQGSFGQGVNFVNNYGLGSNRTLTLVNGRRFVSSNVATLFNQASAGTQVDLNVIPTALTERVDIVSVGGAPVYGSDAISGVVNVVLNTKFDGVDLQATAGVTERGDGFRYNGTAVVGKNFLDDALNVTLSYSRDRSEGILQNARDFYRDNLGNVTNPTEAQAAALIGRTGITSINDGRINTTIPFDGTATDDIPGTILARDITIPYLTGGGLITATAGGAGTAYNFQFDSNGNLVPFDRGIAFPGIYGSGGDPNAFRFSDYGQITSDLKRDIANGFVTWELAPALTFFLEGTYYTSRGDELVQQPSFNSNLFGGANGPLTFSVNSPFLTTQARDLLVSRGVSLFQVSRASADLADLTGYSKTRLYRGVAGVRGDFNLFNGREFNYEVSANFGRNRITDVGQDINRQNFINAVNVASVGGQIVCTTAKTTGGGYAAPGGTPVADANCVPLNLLGEGLSDPAARAYVIQESRTVSKLEQDDFLATVSGSPFDIFGNSVGLSAGYEHRREAASFTPSEFQQQGLGRSVAIGPVSGSYNVDEVFGEVNVPLITPSNGIGFINRLEAFGRGRYVDNTVNGGFFSWAAGGLFSPIPDITFRGNYTKSFRAPAITELFLPISPTFTNVPDLCSAGNRNAGPAPETRNRNCEAFLAKYPTATPLQASQATVPGLSGGNPNLDNEVANSYTFGAVLRPRFLRNFVASVDYVRINITKPITQLSVAQIASACFDNENFDASDPANGNAFCSLIRRDATGQVPYDAANPAVTSQFINGNRIFFSGIQGGFDWILDAPFLSSDSKFEIGGTGLYVRRRLIDTTGVAPTRSDGVFGDPKFAGQVNFRYWNDDWGTSISTNIVGKQIASRTEAVREIQAYKGYATVNASVYFDVQDDFRFTFSVSNLFDRIGQAYYGYLIPGSINDAFGRRFAVSVNKTF
ncbi:TonB-dependent receptor [Tsuneonella deserti]|uniref:TonB-dependent receptor n=1 Tax=Tsuneonella deserti TaxID=2035528 RepID=A0ABQ1S220_9SPHN|nr:TonB-dependent receptor [Tsuneonella deserti]GGD88194.1 TonB-dependent receptor [Tsuneonella deserti]